MSTKLDWVYQDHSRTPEYRAEYKDLVIRAIHDSSPGNPFEDDDGHWPMAVLTDNRNDKPTTYDKIPTGSGPLDPLHRFNDAQLVHWQVHIAKLFNETVRSLMECYLSDEPVGYTTDADVLEDCFNQAWDDQTYSKQFELAEGLYKLLDIPCLCTTVRGYSQGDWADLLIVATPEAQEKLRSQPEGMSDETWAKTLAEDMEGQAKLYKSWAFGDVYGYQLARKVPNPAENDETGHCVECGRDNNGYEGEPCSDDCPMYDDGENVTLEDLDDVGSSCWGFYGDDFAWSGLEEAAIEAAEGFVRVPDKEVASA